MAEEFDDVLLATSRKLTEAGIPHMLTGSYALGFYVSEFRNTNDLDIVMEAKAGDVDSLVAMFPPGKDWYVSEAAVAEAVQYRRMFNAIHFKSGIKIDMIQLKAGEFDRSKLDRRKHVGRDDAGFWIISPEDLLLSKAAWGKRSDSAVQFNDVRVLLRDCPDLDWTYINEWAGRIDVADWIDRARAE